jgi:hypothetical protein
LGQTCYAAWELVGLKMTPLGHEVRDFVAMHALDSENLLSNLSCLVSSFALDCNSALIRPFRGNLRPFRLLTYTSAFLNTFPPFMITRKFL